MEKQVKTKLVLRSATALLAGMFCFGIVAPAPVLAQGKPAAEMGAKKMAKKAKPNTKVMAMQEALNKNGAKLTVDGLMGKKTRIALRSYQKANGLKVTGALDKSTMAKLGL
jgi:peptidoglycan hydrolase-like protein with peptidoglycan-binding domain